MAEIYLSETAQDDLDSFDDETRERLVSKLKDAAEDPNHYLEGLSDRNEYKLRSGDYRAIIDWDQEDEALYTLAIGHRRNVYDRWNGD
ncbi:MAG: type II toxin-antitoxin system RelE/ParE family toxin [Euryarchaeota archaeon]|nr:type II toxin-antitoxin system RelE/ParE family toxin [Euryarchaeota archaeon]